MHEIPPPTSPAETEQSTAARPAIWVGSWLDYNNGLLFGDWIPADQEDAAIQSDIQAILARSPTSRTTGEPAEDWGVFDSDHFGPVTLGESEPVTWIGAVGRGIAEHGPAFAAYAAVVETVDALRDFADDYLGCFASVEQYAEYFTDDAGYNQLLNEAIPDCIRPYVRLDTDAIARDMVAAGDLHVVPAGLDTVFLFAAR